MNTIGGLPQTGLSVHSISKLKQPSFSYLQIRKLNLLFLLLKQDRKRIIICCENIKVKIKNHVKFKLYPFYLIEGSFYEGSGINNVY